MAKDLERELQRLEARLPKCALLDGHQLTGISLTTAVTKVPHKLGRPIRGWVVTNQYNPGTIEEPYSIHFGADSHDLTGGSYAHPAGFSGAAATGLGAVARTPVPYDGHVIGVMYRARTAHVTGSLAIGPRINSAFYSESLTVATGVSYGLKMFDTPATVAEGDDLIAQIDATGVATSAADLVIVLLLTRTLEPADFAIYADWEGRADLATNLHLRATAPVTVDLWVY